MGVDGSVGVVVGGDRQWMVVWVGSVVLVHVCWSKLEKQWGAGGRGGG